MFQGVGDKISLKEQNAGQLPDLMTLIGSLEQEQSVTSPVLAPRGPGERKAFIQTHSISIRAQVLADGRLC